VEETEYPFDYKIKFLISMEKPDRFALKFRIPEWAEGFTIYQEYRESKGYIVVKKEWKNGDEVILEFKPSLRVRQDLNKEYYFTYGPLVLAHPINGEEIPVKEFPLPGFRDLHVKAKKNTVYRMADQPDIRLADPATLTFEGTFLNPETLKPETLKLLPIGRTVLRQTTFKK
jgi:DUF1680 family protein